MTLTNYNKNQAQDLNNVLTLQIWKCLYQEDSFVPEHHYGMC